MKRGIIRIVSGVVLLVLQVLSIIGSAGANVGGNLGYYIGFYSPAIIGISLLVFGSRAYRNEIYSELVLHSKSKKIHTVIKWVGFTVSTLLFIYYLLYFITNLSDFDIFSLFNLFGTLAFSVYALFYMYKKPSSLYSTSLIFIGVAYIYGIIGNLSDYILYLPNTDFFVPYVITRILPRFFAGILYIVVATILFKENFSVKVIKTLGWTIFALEFLNRVVCNVVVLQNFYSSDLLGLIYLLFTIVLMLYISVFEINTLRGAPAIVIEDNYGIGYHGSVSAPPIVSKWQCSCGRVNPLYVSSCVCGTNKNDSINQHKAAITTVDTSESSPKAYAVTADKICFCRKCGNKLIDNAAFCSKCGTKIIKEQ